MDKFPNKLTNMPKENKKRSWEQEILPHIKDELKKFSDQGIKPTLRTMFYRLVSLNVLRNVPSDYQYLAKYTAACRKRSIILKRLQIEKVKRDGLAEVHEDIKSILNSHVLLMRY